MEVLQVLRKFSLDLESNFKLGVYLKSFIS